MMQESYGDYQSDEDSDNDEEGREEGGEGEIGRAHV